jgi:hypothetical protein
VVVGVVENSETMMLRERVEGLQRELTTSRNREVWLESELRREQQRYEEVWRQLQRMLGREESSPAAAQASTGGVASGDFSNLGLLAQSKRIPNLSAITSRHQREQFMEDVHKKLAARLEMTAKVAAAQQAAIAEAQKQE